MFELIRRDGLARIGKLTAGGRTVETPALLPVINPKILTVTPKELKEEFGFDALITNSYIIRNSPELRERALSEGLHGMLGYDGVVMTDSGTFQSYMYGEVGVTNEEMVTFQRDIGSDIGTVLDVFTEPHWTEERTAKAVEETLGRTAVAADLKGDMMLNGVVQGSVFPGLRENCARAMRGMDVDVHPIGGVVPLMEQYRYAELVGVIIASKKGMDPSRPVHLFGAGHPMLLAFATLMGCDLFDSASYAKFARDDRFMFIDGTFRMADMKSLDCMCPACSGKTLEGVRAMGKRERERLIARHNLYQIKAELALIKRYILEGRLWELAEMRCRAHPALLSGLRELGKHSEFLERTEPLSRGLAMFYTGPETRGRPAFHRFRKRLATRYVPSGKSAVFFDDVGKPHGRIYAEEFEKCRRAGAVPVVVSDLGPVPAELDEIYPVAQSVFPEIQDMETRSDNIESTLRFVDGHGLKMLEYEDLPIGDLDVDADAMKAVAVSRYQFGIEATDALFDGDLELVKSRKTGKIRNVVCGGEHVLSMRAGDGLYTLRPEGARRILEKVPGESMRVMVTADAAKYVMDGRNVFCGFVLSADPEIRPMEEVIVIDPDGKFVATGRAQLTADEMACFKRGVAVRVRKGSGGDEE
ncbi:MAG: tRNA guanosine(15) transglycosylase TgtA [Thermoplasmatales archaeon]|nr:tRNA guanosine(15) transglycosylase TgtA [Thermoplasmatales archaeon]